MHHHGHDSDRSGFGVRRPLRFLAHKLDLDEKQIAELVRILDDLKTERAQAEVDDRRSLAEFADSLAGDAFDAAKAGNAGERRVQSAAEGARRLDPGPRTDPRSVTAGAASAAVVPDPDRCHHPLSRRLPGRCATSASRNVRRDGSGRGRPAAPSPPIRFIDSVSLGMARQLGRAGCADDPGLRVDRDAGPVADEHVTLFRR